MANIGINADAEGILGALSSNPYSGISDTASSYSDEWKTIGVINDAFTSLKYAMQGFDNLKASASNYAHEGIETDDPKNAPELDYGKYKTDQMIKAAEATRKSVPYETEMNSEHYSILDGYKGNPSAAHDYITKTFVKGSEGYNDAARYFNENNKTYVGTEKFDLDRKVSDFKQNQVESLTPDNPLPHDKTLKTATVNTKSGVVVRNAKGERIAGAAMGSELKLTGKPEENGRIEVELEDGTKGTVSSQYLKFNDEVKSNTDLTSSKVKNINSYGAWKNDVLTKNGGVEKIPLKDTFGAGEEKILDDYIKNGQSDYALRYAENTYKGDALNTVRQYIHEKSGK